MTAHTSRRSGFTLAFVLMVAAPVAAQERRQAIRLGHGPHLFIDDHLVASQSGLKRKVLPPARLDRPVVTGPEDKCFQPYVTVLQDPKTKLFRGWYGVPESAIQSHLGYLESEDGIHWKRPHRVLADPARIQFGTSVIDEGPDYPDPAKRYKWGWWHDGGLNVAASADGLAWTLLAPGPVLKHNHDINCIFRDPLRKRYIAMVSTYTTGKTWTGHRRIPMQSVSDDLIHWKEPWQVITLDEKDEGETQFYCMGGLIARGDLLIGMLKVLRDDLPADPGGPVAGIGYTVLAWSRDGAHWQRDREPFMNRSPQPGSWDHAMTWADCQLIVNDETYIYYGGYARGHKVERFTERQIGLARMPRDRYIARAAGKERGSLRTPAVMPAGKRLIVNAKIEGELRVRILDKNGKPLAGFDFEDCRPSHGDSLRHAVGWKDFGALPTGEPVSLEFALQDGDLYGFELLE